MGYNEDQAAWLKETGIEEGSIVRLLFLTDDFVIASSSVIGRVCVVKQIKVYPDGVGEHTVLIKSPKQRGMPRVFMFVPFYCLIKYE